MSLDYKSVISIKPVISIAAFVTAMSLASGAGAGCIWKTGSAVPPPDATALRSYAEPYGAPGRVAVDFEGNIYAVNTRAGKVLVWNPVGTLVFESEHLGGPTALAISPHGDIYVGEQYSGSVLVFDPDWNPLGKLGSGDGEFLIPNDISIDPVSGAIYVADGFAYEVRVYHPSGLFNFSFGGYGTGDAQFRFPSAVHVTESGEVLVGDQPNDNVKVFDLQGNFLRCFGSSGGFLFKRRFGHVAGLASDALGRYYVADSFQGNVQVFDSQGLRLSTIGSFGQGPGQLRTPTGLAIDPFNRLFVGSTNTGRLEFYGLDDFSDPQPPPASIPQPPTNLAATAVSTSQVDLDWADNSDDEGGFVIYRQDGGSWLQIDVTSAGDTDYTDTGLLASTTYFYFVRAFNDAGLSAASNQVSATTLDPPPPMIPATVDLDPWQIKRNTKKSYVTAYVEVPDSDVGLIDTTTITANGVAASQQFIAHGDNDLDGIPDIAVKFDTQALLATLPDGDSTVLVAGGLFDGTLFEGTAPVTVIQAKGK